MRRMFEGIYVISKEGGSFRVTIPKIILERKSKMMGMSMNEFIKKFVAAIRFDGTGNVDATIKFRRK